MKQRSVQPKEDIALIKICLLCSIRALTPWDCLFARKNIDDTILSESNFEINSNKLLVYFLLDEQLNKLVYDIALQLVEAVIAPFEYKTIVHKELFSTDDQVQQYLRKFNFLYRYYYANTYPNNLSRLSTKKTNLLAIKSLFFLNSL